MATVLEDPREATLTRCKRHVSQTGAISYTCTSESDPTQEGYYTLRMRPGFKVWSCNCPAGREGRPCKHVAAVVQLENEYQEAAHENSSVKRSGMKAYTRAPFDLLLASPGKENTMTKLNIRQGDVPETDAEVEAALEKMRKQEARKAEAARGKPSAKNQRQSKLSLSQAQAAASGALPQQQDVMGDVLQKSTPGALLGAALTQAAKPKKTAKPKAAKKDLNPKGHAFLTPRLVKEVFNAVDGGMSREQASEKFNLSLASVGTVMSPPKWFKVRMTEVEPGFVYPTRTPKEKTSEKKEAQKES